MQMDDFIKALDAALERIAELEAFIREWLDYEHDTSDCPRCCDKNETCLFRKGAALVSWENAE